MRKEIKEYLVQTWSYGIEEWHDLLRDEVISMREESKDGDNFTMYVYSDDEELADYSLNKLKVNPRLS
jgi:hypothetical protein